MVKGFVRLWVVFTVLIWVGAIVFLLRESGKNLDLFINPHLRPHFWLALERSPGSGLPEYLWCVLIARPEFLAKPTNERANIAKAFFHEHIEPIARITYVDVETFRAEFVKSATLSIEEAPIEKWIDSNGTPYRDLAKHAWHGGIQLSKIAFSLGTLLYAVLGGAMIATVPSLMIVGRWAYRGFSARLALVLWVAWMLWVVGWFWHGYIQETAEIARNIGYEVAAGNLELAISYMQEVTLDTLAQRMNRLEREVRRWRLGAIMLLTCAVAALVMGQTLPKSKVIEAEGFILKSRDGKVHAILGVHRAGANVPPAK